MARQFKGRTEDADAVFLGAEFWKPGISIAGRVARTWISANGPCYVIDPCDGVEINGDELHSINLGNMAGFRMALQAAGLDGLQVGDHIALECTGLKSTTKGSPRVDFSIEVTRP